MTKLIEIKLNNGLSYEFETNDDVNIEEALKQEVWSLSFDDRAIYIPAKNILIVKVIEKE